jgi:hypothetical protein
MPNIQVTHNTDLNNARSESAILANPNNPLRIVASSKKFRNIQNYDFTLATSFSSDGGLTWHDSADVPTPDWDMLSDPTLAWDDAGNVFLVGLPANNPPNGNVVGIAVYKSTDGGQTWSNPNLIHTSGNDDKQWVAGDANPSSPFHGRLYIAWDDGSTMRFARSLDHGTTWIGVGSNTINNTSLATDSFSPEINVAADGTIYIVWINGIFSGNTIKMLVSTNGGDSFFAATPPATGVTGAAAVLPSPNGWPNLPGANFRLVTVPTACVFGQALTVAWDDFREGVGRIYYALSPDRGASWTTGASGAPMLTEAIPANFHHFFPQIITDPNGVIGCTFYEFGPKPMAPLIDVMMAESYDHGASFQHFTVTDRAWDPAVDAPLARGNPNVTFIGDYFGIDASGRGFYPLWTDTRTGIQELWTAIVPERRCTFIVERSTLGQDEVDARRGQPGGAVVPDAFRVVVDGFSGTQFGVTGPSSVLNVASPVAGMTIVCTGNTADTGGYGPQAQRFTFHYNIDFGPTDTAFNFIGPSRMVTLGASVLGIFASAEIELIKQPNPFILHGDPAWLSIDLRVFVVRAHETRFGATMGADAASAPAFIQNVMSRLNAGHGSAGGQTFDGLPTDEAGSSLFVFPSDDNGAGVFNFALARVRYIGQIGAGNVRVFFRMFAAQSTTVAFDPATSYRRAAANPHGQPIALAGIRNREYVTIPFFASPRIDTATHSMAQQTDDPNVQNISPSGGAEVDRFFGCWLDINQPFKPTGGFNNVLPVIAPFNGQDGPFGSFNFTFPVPIQQAFLRNQHQCLIAEIAFDPVPIPFGKDPGNWDKLAQRNVAWSDLGSGRALDTFEIRATPVPPTPSQPADELMIDWGNTPAGTVATIYLPGVNADDVLDMASRMYTNRRLARVDDHTLQCKAGGITYIPVPYASNIDFAGLLSLDLPANLRIGQAFTVVVRQITNAFPLLKTRPGLEPAAEGNPAASADNAAAIVVPVPRPTRWKKVLGAFQLTMPVHARETLLRKEERILSVMLWIAEAIPSDSRWHPVFQRYLQEIAGRVTVFGGDPGQIQPSPTGDGKKPPCPAPEDERAVTGKICALIFDHFGDFAGFVLETEHGEHRFHSREKELEELAERAWKERLRITVHADRNEPHRPRWIVVHQPPAAFGP